MGANAGMQEPRASRAMHARVLAMCCSLAFLAFAPRAIVGVYQRQLLNNFDWSGAWSVNWQIVQAVSLAIAAPVAGALADRFGFARVAVAGALAAAAGLAVLTVSTEPLVLMLGAGLLGGVGLGSATFPLALQPLADDDAANLGWATAAAGLGALVLTPLAFALVGWAGWSPAVAIFASFLFAGGVLAWKTIKGGAKSARASTSRFAVIAGSGSLLAQSFLAGVVFAFASQRFQKFSFDAEMSANAGAMALLLLCIANVVCAFAAALATARAGAARAFGAIAILRVTLLIALIFAPATPVWVFCIAVLLGASWLPIWPPLAALLRHLNGAGRFGQSLGEAFCAWQLGGLAGGFLHLQAGASRSVWYSLAVLALAAILPALRISRRLSLHVEN